MSDDPRYADRRCCGDHPNDWNVEAEPGSGFCAACIARLRPADPIPGTARRTPR